MPIEIDLGNGDKLYADSFADAAKLFSKISKVIGETVAPKKGKVGGEGGGYAYQSWDDVSFTLSASMKENGLALIASTAEPPQSVEAGKTSSGKPMYRVYTKVRYVLACGETGAFISSTWYGESNDLGDKGTDKSLTYNAKSFLKKTFLISTKEDADEADSHNYEQEADFQPPAQTPQRQQQNPQQQKPVEKPADANPFSQKTGASFMESAAAMGFDKDRVPSVLGMFYPVVNGKVYNSNKHDEMLGTLGDWNKLYYDMLEPMKGGELNDVKMSQWFEYMGLKAPFTVEQLQALVPVYAQYMDFSRETVKFSEDRALIGKILKEANLSPWRPEKTELALAALANHFKVEQIQEEIVEQGIDNPPFATQEVTDEPSEDEEADQDPLAGIGGDIEF